jgi:hypothetical protein
MPSTSKKQHNFMEAVAHNPSFAKKAGVPQSVGKEFSKADKGKTFSRGGDMATKMDPKMMAMMAQRRAAPRAPARPMAPMAPSASMESSAGMPGMKKGGATKKMSSGGFTRSADGIAKKGKTKGTMVKMGKGGMAC